MSAKVRERIEKLAHEAHELQRSGEYARAEEPLQMVVSLSKLLHGASHMETLRAEMNLAVSYRRRGDAALSLPILERVTAGLCGQIGDPEGAYLYRMALNNLAASLRWTGDLAKARASLELCLSMVELALPLDPDAREEQARVLDNLADVLVQQGDLSAAEEHAGRGLAAWLELRGEQDLDVGISMSHLGGIYLRRGNLTAARAFLERSLQLIESIAGPDHPTVGGSLNLLGALELSAGNLDVARERYTRSVTLGRQRLTEDHPQVVEALEGLAEIERLRGALAN